MPALCCRRFQDVVLAVHSAEACSPSEWRDFLRLARQAASDTGNHPLTRWLVVSEGGHPTPEQLAEWVDLSRQAHGTWMPVAVVGDALEPGQKTLMAEGFNARDFSFEQAEQAVHWLALDGRRAHQVLQILEDALSNIRAPRAGAAMLRALQYRSRESENEVQLRAEQQRVTQELHDGLCSTLTGLSFRLQMLTHRGDHALADELESLTARLRGVLAETRCVVWALRQERITWRDCQSYAQSLVEQELGGPCVLDDDATGDGWPVGPNDRRTAKENTLTPDWALLILRTIRKLCLHFDRMPAGEVARLQTLQSPTQLTIRLRAGSSSARELSLPRPFADDG